VIWGSRTARTWRCHGAPISTPWTSCCPGRNGTCGTGCGAGATPRCPRSRPTTWERAEFPVDLVTGYGRLGIAGASIVGDGCPGLSYLAEAMIAAELARGDGSIATFERGALRVGDDQHRHAGFRGAAGPVPAADGDLPGAGAFALTEPRHGSDVVALETRARRDGDAWVLDGAKRWIGNGTVAGIVVVWARDDDGQVGAFVVEHPDGADHPVPGYHARKITGKAANRGVWQAHIRLDGVRVPADARLAKARSWDDANYVLAKSRQTVAWEALGLRCSRRGRRRTGAPSTTPRPADLRQAGPPADVGTGCAPGSTPAHTAGTATRVPVDARRSPPLRRRSRCRRSPPATDAEEEPGNSTHQPQPESTTPSRPASRKVRQNQILRQVTRLASHVLATSPLGDDRQDSWYLLLRTITYLLNAGGAARFLTLELHERWQRVLGPDQSCMRERGGKPRARTRTVRHIGRKVTDHPGT